MRSSFGSALRLIALVVLFLGGAGQARAEVVYMNDFERPLGTTFPEWTSTGRPAAVARTPTGNRGFLGEFDNGTARLTLGGLPAHTEVTVSFDLFIIFSWDGNSMVFGPDIWELGVGGGPTLLRTTFSNTTDFIDLHDQAFPGAFPGGSNPRGTGAAEINTLGYPIVTGNPGTFGDSVYRLSFTFPHSADSLVLNFTASNLQGVGDESWGLDNVVVSVAGTASGVPEPGTLALLGIGASVTLGHVWQRRRRASATTPG